MKFLAKWPKALRSLGGQTEAALACCSYAFCSISLTLANKAIFSETKLNYPWMILGVQSLVVALLLLMYFTSFSSSAFKPRLFRQMLLPCFFFTAFIFSNARSLRHISLPILTVFKSLAPMGIALVERAVFRENVSTGTYCAMVLIVLGNGVTATNDVEFHPVGYFWAFFNIVMNVAYVISLRFCLSDEYSSAQKTLHSNIIATSFILPLSFLFGEIPGFFQEFQLTAMRFRMLFLFSCFLATGIGASVFWVLKAASGSTLSFMGAMNKVVVVILGAMFFDAKVTRSGWVGVTLGIAAGGCFAASKKLSLKSLSPKSKYRKETLKEDVSSLDSKQEKAESGFVS